VRAFDRAAAAPDDTRQRLFLVLSAIFLTALLIANVVAGKLFRIGPVVLSVGVIPFPITFLLTDIVNEYFGRRGARFLTVVGLCMMLLATGIITLAARLPVAEQTYVSQASFDNVFGLSWRLFLASLSAYLIGQISDIYFFGVFKRLTGSRILWLRATGSTAVSQVVDTAIVNFAVFAGALGLGEIARLAAFGYLYKMAVAVLLTPLLYAAHAVITRRLRIAPFDARGDGAGGAPDGAGGAPDGAGAAPAPAR
jgi:uncharacterized integral membrane protein (TIGR00697 family)